jgi:hypothetical protein
MEIQEKYDLGFIERMGALEKDTFSKRKFDGNNVRGKGKISYCLSYLQDKEDLGQQFQKQGDDILPLGFFVDVLITTTHCIPIDLE